MRTKNPISILNKLMKDLNMYPGGIYSCGQNPSSTGDIYLRQHIDRAYTMIEETIPIRPGSACATRTASTVSSENLDQARENLGSVIEEWRTFVAESDESPPPYPSTNNPLPEHSRPTSQVSNRSGSGVMFSPAPNRRMFTPAAPQGFRPTGVTKKTQIPTSSLHQIASKRIRTEYLQPAPLIVRPSPPRDCPSVASTSSITSDSAFHATPLSSLMSPPSNIYTHMRSQGPGPTRSNAVAEFHPGAGAVVGRQPFNLLQRSRRAAKSGACVTRAKPPKPANPEDH